MTKSEKDTSLHCSFCARGKTQVRKLIEGPEIYICDECVDTCYDIVHPSSSTSDDDDVETKASISPHDIKAHLDEFVIGQDKAKIAVSVAVHNHYKRINDDCDDDVELQKSNILLIGPSGVGKSMIVQTVAKILEVPFATADATSLTETGYVGEDVESIISRLLTSANNDVAAAQHGIVFIDEIDKLRRKGGGAARDVGSEGVQQALLKLLEGSEVMVPLNGQRGPGAKMVKVNTSDILFICGGAFTGIEDIVAKGDSVGIGFGSTIIDKTMIDYGEIEPEHLAKYGMIPEFIGRLPVITTLSDLDEGQLVRVLTEPKNAIVRQFVKLFALDGVKLTFTPEALTEVAKLARKHKTGARSLRSVIEKSLLTLQFNLPTLAHGGVKEVIINADVITHKAEPKFTRRRTRAAK